MYSHACACAHAMHTCMLMYVYGTHTHAYMHTYMYAHTCMHKHAHVHIYGTAICESRKSFGGESYVYGTTIDGIKVAQLNILLELYIAKNFINLGVKYNLEAEWRNRFPGERVLDRVRNTSSSFHPLMLSTFLLHKRMIYLKWQKLTS